MEFGAFIINVHDTISLFCGSLFKGRSRLLTITLLNCLVKPFQIITASLESERDSVRLCPEHSMNEVELNLIVL